MIARSLLSRYTLCSLSIECVLLGRSVSICVSASKCVCMCVYVCVCMCVSVCVCMCVSATDSRTHQKQNAGWCIGRNTAARSNGRMSICHIIIQRCHIIIHICHIIIHICHIRTREAHLLIRIIKSIVIILLFFKLRILTLLFKF